jgi:hypothetical protein
MKSFLHSFYNSSRFIDESLSGHCHIKDPTINAATCAQNELLQKDRLFRLCQKNDAIGFFDAASRSKSFKEADIIQYVFFLSSAAY